MPNRVEEDKAVFEYVQSLAVVLVMPTELTDLHETLL